MNSLSRFPVPRALLASLVCASACTAGWTVATATAGVVAISRSSSIDVSGASGQGTYDDEAGTTAFGSFTDQLEGSVGSGESFTSSSARQDSLVLADDDGLGLIASGDVRGQVGEIGGQSALAESLLVVAFRVIGQAEPFTASGRLTGTLGGSALAELVNDDTDVAVFRAAVDQGSPEGGAPFDEAGVLQPGNYIATFRAFVSGTPSPETSSFTGGFAVGSNPIPLPPALLTGLATLAPVALMSWHSRRRRP